MANPDDQKAPNLFKPFWNSVSLEEQDMVRVYDNHELDSLWFDAEQDIQLAAIAVSTGITTITDDEGTERSILDGVEFSNYEIDLCRRELRRRVSLN